MQHSQLPWYWSRLLSFLSVEPYLIFLSYFHTGGPCCYIKRVISIHLEACCNRDDSRMKGKEEATVSTVDRGPVFILSTGTWNGTLVLMKMRHGSFTVVFGTPGI